ncbi:MAG TPA: aminopeptidase [Kofleriaceae bacterium]|nr:aminopeptidase [Kofleriaceae bacterium]
MIHARTGVAIAIALAAAITTLPGCLMTRYLAQAAHGQLELLGKARPIEEVVRDRNTPLRTALMLAEIPEIKRYGRSYGLAIRRNYTTYSALGRSAAVWFVGAADPVAFKPLRWCFPIVGCFAGLGWFDEDEAVAQEQALERQGYDALVRPAAAYSTGGWFPDPVLSTMLGGGDDALPGLANVILHESVHATVLVADEPFFNESFASYVADALTDHWISVRFGPGSPEDLAWTLGQAIRLPRTARLLDAYDQLKRVYEGPAPRDKKLAAKAKIIDELVTDLHLRKRPNNASLTETRVYNGGVAPIAAAHRACGDVRSLVLAGKTLTRADFARTLQDDLTPIGVLLGARCKKSATPVQPAAPGAPAREARPS